MPKKSKTQCRGCHNDIYNHPPREGCWRFDSARIVKRVAVGTWQEPPYRWQPVKVMSCLYTPGTHWLERTDGRVVADTDDAVAIWKDRVSSHAS